MEEKKPIEESLENLEKASGGANFGTDNADEICFAIGNIYPDFVQIDSPKWPCPKCGSWNVGNYDPGTIWQMRVYCKDCGFFGCRDGDDDNKWGPDIVEELKMLNLL